MNTRNLDFFGGFEINNINRAKRDFVINTNVPHVGVNGFLKWRNINDHARAMFAICEKYPKWIYINVYREKDFIFTITRAELESYLHVMLLNELTATYESEIIRKMPEYCIKEFMQKYAKFENMGLFVVAENNLISALSDV